MFSLIFSPKFGTDGRASNPILSGSREDVLGWIQGLVCLMSFLYLAAVVVFLVLVVFPIDPLYGYYRPELLPGPFVDDRFHLFWFLLLLNNLRIFVPLLLVWCFYDAYSFFKRDITFSALRYMVYLDGIILVGLFVMWCGFCNNGNFRNPICDAPLEEYCKAHWKLNEEVCQPGMDPPELLQADLPFHESFDYWWKFAIVFLVVDIYFVWQMVKFVLYILRAMARSTYNAGRPYKTPYHIIKEDEYNKRNFNNRRNSAILKDEHARYKQKKEEKDKLSQQ